MDDLAQTTEISAAAAPARRYAHVLRAVEERPWALHPPVLRMMADLARLRSAGGRLEPEEIDRRLAAAADDNGARSGAVMSGPVAIVPVYGLLAKRMSLMSAMSGGTSYDELQSAIAELVNDPAVSAIVLDVDSPGGEVDGLTEFAAFVRAARERKPVVAQVDTLAASAAYWIASQCTEVVVTPSGQVGSIGVYTAHQDVSGAMAQDGVQVTLVSAGKYKVEGNPYEPLAEDARAAIQDQVDAYYAMFLGDVARGRGTTPDAVASGYGEGRTVMARAAVAAGMADRVDTLEGTVNRLKPRSQRQRQAASSAPVSIAAAKPADQPAAAAAAPATPDRAWNARVAKLSTRSNR